MPKPEQKKAQISSISSTTQHWVYIVECSDNTLYTGYTTDLEARIFAHNEGKGAKYTRGRLPVKLVYSETHPDKSTAMKREYALKQLSRADKLMLISQD